MGEEGVKKGERRRLSDVGAVVLAGTIAACAAGAALLVPRPVEPTETPGLALDADAVDAVLSADARRAGSAPEDELAAAVEEAFLTQGRIEIGPGDDEGAFRQRRMAAARAVNALRAEHGEEGLDALRSHAVERLADARENRMRADERDAFLGRFGESLRQYGLVVDGHDVAPEIVVRTLFKARWNASLHLPMTDGLAPVELEAYWGWLALEGAGAPLELRLEALGHYEEALGHPSDEARATLVYRLGDPLAAKELFERAYDENGSVRLRNHAIAALAAGVPDE